MADAFAAHQSDSVSRTKRSAPMEIREKVYHVPAQIANFNNNVRQRLDEIVDKIKSMDVSKIDITGHVVFFSDYAILRAEAVKKYLVDQGIDSKLIATHGPSAGSDLMPKGLVEIVIKDTPRQQASTDAVHYRSAS